MELISWKCYDNRHRQCKVNACRCRCHRRLSWGWIFLGVVLMLLLTFSAIRILTLPYTSHSVTVVPTVRDVQLPTR